MLEVAARSAADLLEINLNSAALFYRKQSATIWQANEIFDGEIELDESYFGGKRKGKKLLLSVTTAGDESIYQPNTIAEFLFQSPQHQTYLKDTAALLKNKNFQTIQPLYLGNQGGMSWTAK